MTDQLKARIAELEALLESSSRTVTDLNTECVRLEEEIAAWERKTRHDGQQYKIAWGRVEEYWALLERAAGVIDDRYAQEGITSDGEWLADYERAKGDE